jgi:coenzyme Q-binding protein COQ10
MKHKISAKPLVGGWEMAFPRYTPDQLFAVASDIEKYPAFIPGCVAARIVERGEKRWRVDNVYAFGPMRYRFQSTAELDPPGSLDITSSDGPWQEFRLQWAFSALATGSHLSCKFNVLFRNSVVAAVAAFGNQEMERRIMNAFIKRAESLYGATE